MLSLYEILKASKTGIAPDMRTALAGMNWGGADSGHEVKELTGIPPLSIRSNGTMLLDYLISGNMSQTGTPTPTTPIQPSECGDLETVGVKAGQYKIPILSAEQTTTVYLGEVETTRQIGKLVLTGNENWIQTVSSLKVYRTNIPGYLREMVNIPISTHYKGIAPVIGAEGLKDLETAFLLSSSGNNYYYIRDDRFNNANNFKAYLQQQYAAGTPVTVWYILATPTTGIVNEPLRKIGDYADTVSYEQAGVQIPTNRDNTVIDVETTLKPSQMYIKYQE